MQKKWFLVLFIFSVTLKTVSSVAVGSVSAEVALNRDLISFHLDTAKAMNKLPADVVGNAIKDRGAIDYTVAKSKFKNRQQIFEKNQYSVLSAPLSYDLAEIIVTDGTLISNIVEIEKIHLPTVEVENTPWADSYWPTYRGSIGIRYNDSLFPNSNSFQENYNFVNQNPAQEILASQSNELTFKNY